MNDNTLKSGSLLQAGKYKITDVLGQGGFGITYEAEQVSLGRKVAVKEFFMKDTCNRDETTSQVSVPSVGSQELVEKFRQKFIREARMIAGLDHDHIVKIHDVFEENGTAYYVMEYLSGGSLDRKIKERGSLPEPEALGFIRQIADALSYLHSQNILHFDVKPSNVLLGKNGSAKLIDFGISKHYDESGVQTSSTPVGISKGYAPLEQYKQGSDINSFTPATDIYALGATLYALLAGVNPPEASDVNDDGCPVIDGVSPTVMRAIEKAMQPRRKDRPQRVEEFLKLLDGALTNADEESTILDTKHTPQLSPSLVHKSAPNSKHRHLWKWLLGILEVSATILWLVEWGISSYWQLVVITLIGVAIVLAWLLKISVIRPSGKRLHKYNNVLKWACVGFVPCFIACGIWYLFPSDKIGTIEYVELGLSVKWATCNIGAARPEESGNYYAWGETKTKRLFRSINNNAYNKRQELLLSDDVAHIKWGGNWRMPTEAEFQELIDKCTWTWTTLNGKYGYKVESKVNGNFIFLPAAGHRAYSFLSEVGSYGEYWSSLTRNSFFVYCLSFTDNFLGVSDYGVRSYGLSVRPVCP